MSDDLSFDRKSIDRVLDLDVSLAVALGLLGLRIGLFSDHEITFDGCVVFEGTVDDVWEWLREVEFGECDVCQKDWPVGNLSDLVAYGIDTTACDACRGVKP